MKKIIATVLCLCMIFSAFSVFAESKALKQEIVNDTFKGEIIVSAEKAEKTGTWTKSKAILNYDDGPNWFAAPDAENGNPTISFKPEKALEAGNYELYFWTPFHQNNVEKLDMTVFHNGKESSTFVYPRIDKEETAEPGWVSLGVFDFAGNGNEYVYLEAMARNTRATAVKFVPTDKEAKGKDTTSVPTDSDSEKKPLNPGEASLPHVIESDPVGYCKYVGDWAFSGRVPGPMTKAPSSLWIESAGPETYVEYNPDIMNNGTVRVSVYLLYWEKGHVDDVKYTVHHNGKADEFHLNPAALKENEWKTLGTFDFEGGGKDFVRMECTGKAGNTRATTVAFEIMNEANGTVWQTLYVTPTQDNNAVMLSQSDIMAKLDKFADMKDHWAHYDVEYMANEGLIAGKGESAFDPDANITRAEYLTILDRAMGYELVTGETFSDVPQDLWYATYVATAKANGLLEGLPTDDGFKPDSPITREDMALFTYNAIKATKKNDEWVTKLPTDFAKFTDTAEISDYAKQALEYLVQTGIIKGMTDTTVAPKGNATRAQGAVILKRFMQQFVWAGPPTNDEWVLTFSDEFEGDAVDWDIWNSSNYESSSNILSTRGPDNAEVHDGALHMVTKKETKGTGNREWTTCHMALDATVFRQKYGYWEARYKICASSGINNAFWMITGAGTIMDYKQSYEIDINEGHFPNEVCCTYHYKSTGDALAHSGRYRAEYDLSKDYHTYALEWNPDELIYYHDGKEVVRVPNENAHVALVPLLSTAVSSWGGSITDVANGTAQVVDYVRIYARKKDADNPEYVLRNQPLTPADDGSGIAPAMITEQKIDETVYDGEIVLLPELTGTWSPTSASKAQEGGRHWVSSEKGATADFKFKDAAPGKYKIFFWRLVNGNNKPQENIYITKADGTEEFLGSVALIPSDEDPETNKVGWIYVGEAEIESTDFVRITSNGLYTRASGLKLVPVK